MRKESASMAFGKSGGKIEVCLSDDKLRLTETAFTRDRCLGAKRILQMILFRIYRALQLHLDDYYAQTGDPSVSKQAFSKARKNLNPEYVREFFDMTAEIAAEDDTLDTYRGMRLIAIDGSDAALENTEELKDSFGCSGPKKNAATALCSVAYGPLDHVIYDCRIDRYEKDERELAKQHVERLCELGLRVSLLLFDRWYPSAEFIAFLYENGFPFVMRARSKWNLKADNVETDDLISITHNGKTYPVRVMKIFLPTGEIETLLTSLDQEQLPLSDAGALYFKRWGVETSYDLLKSKLQLENFSGKTAVSVRQDFYATMYLANMTAFVAGAADELITINDQGKNLKYPRRASRNRTIYKLRQDFLRLLMEPHPVVRYAMLSRIVAAIAEKPVSVVPGRSPPHKFPRNKRFPMAKKSVV